MLPEGTFGGEHTLFWDKTLSLSGALFVINRVVVILIFSKLLFQLIIFPRVSVLSEGVGEREQV